MRPLENDPENPCIGCGPGNPIGLRLAFAWDGEGVVAAFVVGPNHQGWPGSCHTGVLYIALVETLNWTLWGALGRAGLPRETSALATRRRVAVGEALTLRGRVLSLDGAPRVRAEALARGEVVASLERAYDLPDAAEAARRLGFERLPGVLAGLFPG